MEIVKLFSDDDASSLARRVCVRRDALGLTTSELADAAGVALSTVARIERGEVEAPRCIDALARALRVEANWLISGMTSDDDLSDEAIELAMHWRMLPEPYRSSFKSLVAHLAAAGTAHAAGSRAALSDNSSAHCAAA